MPFSWSSTRFDAFLLAALLPAAVMLATAAPARADRDDRDGQIGAREVMETIQDQAQERTKLFFGDSDPSSPDPVRDRAPRLGGDRVGNFEDPYEARRLLAEEFLDGIEDRLNEGRWIPFWGWGRDRKASGPEILFGLDDPTPEPVVGDDSWRSRFRLSLVRGLEYRQEFAAGQGDGKLQMRLFAPIVPGGPGLGFQLKGRMLERRFRLNAYGGASEAGLSMEIEF